MKPVFADTYYWLALINPRDQAHGQALALSQSLSGPLITTAWVLAEVGDAMRSPANRPKFIQLLQDLADDRDSTLVPADQLQFNQGARLFAGRLDKAWSLTDCVSIWIMEDQSLTQALTADHHFVQAGFTILMQ